jgi:ribose transport system ATP-binding protein
VVGQARIGETGREQLIGLISGEARTVLHSQNRVEVSRNNPLLHLRLGQGQKLKGIEVSLFAGEILGLGGLQGQGQSELLLSLFGALPVPDGSLSLGGQPQRFYHPDDAMKAGLAYVPGDRNREGLMSARSIFENFMLPSWKQHRQGLLLNMGQARTMVLQVGQKLKFATLDHPITSLSGGNAQKVVLGKWLLRSPKVLLLDDPTKGIDVGAKAEFYQLLQELRAEGMGVVFYSSDDEELLSLCDRVLVMLEGQIVAELQGEGLSRERLIRTGLGAA